MANWLHNLVAQHKDLESPESFWYWGGLAAISAVIKDNVWIERQIFRTYGNIYVMYHADSGLKKGPPVNMAAKLVSPLKVTRVIKGRSSVQGILKALGSAHTEPGGKVIARSVAFICSSELSSSIVEDPVATKILTDLYDRQYNEGEWASLLKMESFQLKDPTITMLTATNEAMSEDFFTRSAIQGGYFARTFIVYEKSSPVSNSLIYDLENPPNYTSAIEYLRELTNLKGPFKPLASLTPNEQYRFKKVKQGRDMYFNEAGYRYDTWYDDFRKSAREQEVEDKTGTLNRFGDSVLKVAMLLALAEKPVLEISGDAMDEAIIQCEKLLGNVRKTTLGKHGLSNTAVLKGLVITELLERDPHTATRAVMMKKYWMHYSDPAEFDGMMTSFESAGLITITMQGANVLYTMPDKQVDELKRYMSGKNK